MPIVWRILNKKGRLREPTPKALRMLRSLRSGVAPQRCSLSSLGANLGQKFGWCKFFPKKLRKLYVKGLTALARDQPIGMLQSNSL